MRAVPAADRNTLRSAPVRLRVDTSNGTAEHTFAFDLTGTASGTMPWMWIRELQGRRTIQNVELPVEIVPAVESR